VHIGKSPVEFGCLERHEQVFYMAAWNRHVETENERARRMQT
jgi:hypothetical protein